MAESFIKNPNNLPYVLFKDGNCNNLYFENLYWSKHKSDLKQLEMNKKKKNKNSVSQRRKKIKKMSVDYKGGKCIICGYNRCLGALEFHHLNPNEKDFGISASGTTKSWEKIKSELDKCICVCSNCHREIY